MLTNPFILLSIPVSPMQMLARAKVGIWAGKPTSPRGVIYCRKRGEFSVSISVTLAFLTRLFLTVSRMSCTTRGL